MYQTKLKVSKGANIRASLENVMVVKTKHH